MPGDRCRRGYSYGLEADTVTAEEAAESDGEGARRIITELRLEIEMGNAVDNDFVSVDE